ncbi:hypothetical protein Ato02nite_090060 [Paractinoplanes toevensis]|uniref:Uncharacterized protein n=1 Tax=Paractinoplanes toevensis TaxID=571911 RepID=A0A920BQH4_9ACTN|nr:hypothetical protein Ato02nite_090060 [Actinoplanes toevensis]
MEVEEHAKHLALAPTPWRVRPLNNHLLLLKRSTSLHIYDDIKTPWRRSFNKIQGGHAHPSMVINIKQGRVSVSVLSEPFSWDFWRGEIRVWGRIRRPSKRDKADHRL